MRIEDELQSRFRNDYHKLAVNIRLTSARTGEVFNEELRKRELTSTQYNVLRILRGQDGNAVSISLIKERMIEPNSDVSRVIDRLVKKKLIERKANKKDKRQRDVRITEKGMNLLADIDNLEELFVDEFSHLSIKEVELLNELLDKARRRR